MNEEDSIKDKYVNNDRIRILETKVAALESVLRDLTKVMAAKVIDDVFEKIGMSISDPCIEGDKLNRRGDLYRAANQYIFCLRGNSEKRDAWFELGKILYKLDMLDYSKICFKKALSLGEKRANYFLNEIEEILNIYHKRY